MLYSLTFSDGSSTFLVHYGIKGMRWGEWNEETKQRYGISDNDELSKLKAFRETSYVLPAGSPVGRFTSPHEVENGTDLTKRFYASANEHDYDVYADEARRSHLNSSFTEGVLKGGRNDAVGVVRLSTVDDMNIARGQFVVGELFREDSIALPHGLREDPGGAYTDQVLTSPEVQNHFRKLGYDAIEDLVDQRAEKISNHPLIVFNGDKMQVDSSTVVPRTDAGGNQLERDKFKYPSWD